MPHLDGERTPNRPDAAGTLTGIRSDITREHLARAAHEGVVANLLAGAAALGQAADSNDDRVFLVGGGARNPAYRQVVADLIGRQILVPSNSWPEASPFRPLPYSPTEASTTSPTPGALVRCWPSIPTLQPAAPTCLPPTPKPYRGREPMSPDDDPGRPSG